MSDDIMWTIERDRLVAVCEEANSLSGTEVGWRKYIEALRALAKHYGPHLEIVEAEE